MRFIFCLLFGSETFSFLLSPTPVAQGFLGYTYGKPLAAAKPPLPRGAHTCTLAHPEWRESTWADPC